MNITITILGIIRCPVFYLKYSISETGFYLLLQVEPTQLSPMLCSRRQAPPKTEAESSLRKVF
jgi:hypothetical protein